MKNHVVQSKEWGEFKTKYGTPAVRVGNIQYTIHKVPYTGDFYAYCPKVKPIDINYEEVQDSLIKNNCIAINFDIPNVIKGSENESRAVEIFESKCKKSPKDTFAKFNILLDISKSEEEILNNMHKKHRYNIKYSQRNGVTVRKAENENDYDIFYTLLKDTAERQKYYIHPKGYYKKIWEQMGVQNIGTSKSSTICHILIAELNSEPVASWMLFTYEGVLYYPYGGSSTQHKNLYASNLICWESILLGKKMGCENFDMWGAAKDPNDEEDSWQGFTNFKLKFGGKHVEYINSYDFVINEQMYNAFNIAQKVRWAILKLLK